MISNSNNSTSLKADVTRHEEPNNVNSNPLHILNIDIAQKSKPTIASTNLQYTASTHDHTQTLELNRTPKNASPREIPAVQLNLERDFPVEVMAPDSLNNSLTSSASMNETLKKKKKPLIQQQQHHKLVRTYSETETTNFNSTTGVRLFDDHKHRPYHGFPSTRRVSFTQNFSTPQKEPQVYGINNTSNKIHHNSYINYTSVIAQGLEDEYVPDFKFGDNLLNKWFDDDDEIYSEELDLKKRKLQLHTDLTPISVPVDNYEMHGKLQKIDLNSLQSLPENFKDLPFSQRKKILQNIYPNHSYTELTNMIKTYVKSNSATSLPKLSTRSSSSSIAASYLSNMRMFSSSHEVEYDVNKKNAVVMNHVLMDIVGRGAWGVIRECRDLTTNEVRAVKIISIQNERVKMIFMNEIHIWAMLNHSNILPLLAFRETRKNLFAITKMNYGGTLFELIYKWGYVKDHKIKLELRQARTMLIVRQILDGLKYMHNELSLIHGDLKLENVLIDLHDKIMICDFGMAKFYRRETSHNDEEPHQRPLMLRSKSDQLKLNEKLNKLVNDRSKIHDDTVLSITAFNKLGPSLTSTTLTPNNLPNSKDSLKMPDKHIGSLPYAAPELLTPEVAITPKQDIWSIGILIYTMLVGELPFKHDYEPRLRMMILHGKIDKTVLEEEYGEHSKLVEAVRGCLQMNADERWNVDQLYDALYK